jgi:hypothetical protein
MYIGNEDKYYIFFLHVLHGLHGDIEIANYELS